MPNTNKISITEAALQLGVSREAAIRLLQRGELEGGKQFGRYFATLKSVNRLKARRGNAPL